MEYITQDNKPKISNPQPFINYGYIPNTNKQLWFEFCSECNDITAWRYLDCSDCRDKGETCPLVICCNCGAGHEENKLKFPETNGSDPPDNSEKTEFENLLEQFNSATTQEEKVEIFQKLWDVAPVVTRGGLWEEDIPILTKEMESRGYELVNTKLEIDEYHYEATFKRKTPEKQNST